MESFGEETSENPRETNLQWSRTDILEMGLSAYFFGSMLNDRNFFEGAYTDKPSITDFDFIEVNDKTRMKIALDLVMGKHNPIADEKIKMAIYTWDKSVHRAVAKLKRKKKKKKVARKEP
ncbi:hypothetical protein PIB30_058945 [Stylosanthes scabra]|uniref:Uncharacterized protein n=1 Tax=Stylosanthes scabra TaxID=79078 RepID=A0ABU6YHK5_9FABA|nr:hypothetical protein [Stylosanthes scabra]